MEETIDSIIFLPILFIYLFFHFFFVWPVRFIGSQTIFTLCVWIYLFIFICLFSSALGTFNKTQFHMLADNWYSPTFV